MSFQHIGKGALRVAKNYTKGYSDVQAKLRDATSNDPWGPSGTQMNEIAQLTYNQNDFVEIMEMLDKRLNDKGKNWRHVFKALTVLDYCLHAGSENVVIYFRDNIYLVKTLKEFQFVDEFGKDQGANVRQKAKDITSLLQDEARLRQERRSRANMRDRMIRGGGPGGDEEVEEETSRRRSRSVPAPSSSRRNREDDELKKAIEASKVTAQAEADKAAVTAEERDLQRAIKMSEDEEAKKAKAVEDANSRSLFDEAPAAQPAANFNPFPLVNPTGLQPQFIQPQLTSFNPYLQAQQEQAQAEYMRQQAEWQQQQLLAQQQFAQQEWVRQQAEAQQSAQQNEWLRQQAELQAQQQAQQQQAQAEWAMQQQLQAQQLQAQQQANWLQAQQPLVAQPTGFGSKNPFALMGGATSATPPIPQVTTPTPSFQPQPTANASYIPSVKVNTTTENQALAALFANRDGGTDTFGNYGNLRLGHNQSGRMLTTNPTGAPQTASTGNEQPFFSL